MTKSQNMPSLFLKISEAEIDKLSYERYGYPDPVIQKRIFAVYLKATLGWSNLVIGRTVGLHYNAVGEWIGVYRKKGFAGLLKKHYGCRSSEMERHCESILQSFQNQPPLTGNEAAERIKYLTGLVRSPQQVRVFMKRHGLKFIKCGHIPSKADNNAQHNWVEA